MWEDILDHVGCKVRQDYLNDDDPTKLRQNISDTCCRVVAMVVLRCLLLLACIALTDGLRSQDQYLGARTKQETYVMTNQLTSQITGRIPWIRPFCAPFVDEMFYIEEKCDSRYLICIALHNCEKFAPLFDVVTDLEAFSPYHSWAVPSWWCFPEQNGDNFHIACYDSFHYWLTQ